jgi:hypothetical protein
MHRPNDCIHSDGFERCGILRLIITEHLNVSIIKTYNLIDLSFVYAYE